MIVSRIFAIFYIINLEWSFYKIQKERLWNRIHRKIVVWRLSRGEICISLRFSENNCILDWNFLDR
ncbi:hypothetical protein LEP1GSC172_1851 [Leptospira noguchii]|uniref:Uncharacterized protein n=1 Tax=Leptospira noguchii TaxID=28182 RepID=M6V9I6_9LEPT|nr:hypothetical protein LEP1GSC172_1851 [Leptospira noguchii]